MAIRLISMGALMALGWQALAIAQERPATREALLDVLGTLWVQHSRQPTPEEIDAGGTYKNDLYLREWQSWEAVRQALAEHLYQKGLLASIQGNEDKAGQFYRQCLMVDPQHINARNGLAEAIALDLDAAAKRRTDFLPEKAGPEASVAFYAFLVAYDYGRKEEAQAHYQRAVASRETYIRAEIERLNALYAEAVAAFDRKEYAKAIEKFEELRTLKTGQPGYTAVYQLHVSEIDSYITRAQTITTEHRSHAILTATRAARFAFWASAGYYALPSEIGFKIPPTRYTPPQLLRVNPESFLGSDMGVAWAISPSIHAGTSVLLLMNAPNGTYETGGKLHTGGLLGMNVPVSFDGGSIIGLSGFVQPGGFIGDQVRGYGQTGITWYRIRFPEGYEGNKQVVFAYSESAPGFFFGGGMDLFTQAIGKAAWGLKFDLKYHIVRTSEQAPNNQKLKLNGLRLGIGLVLSR